MGYKIRIVDSEAQIGRLQASPSLPSMPLPRTLADQGLKPNDTKTPVAPEEPPVRVLPK